VKYEAKQKEEQCFSTPTNKRIRLDNYYLNQSPLINNIISSSPKYPHNSEFPNMSADGWSDATVRSFNGYVCQGIDNDWNLVTLPVEFRHFQVKKT
jgi:hypothetical protein